MKDIVQSAMFTVAMRWSDRLIGLISTLVLARLLVPEDFGIIAMASLVIALADVLFDLGVHVTLIQNRAPLQEHFDTAWTLAILQSAVAAAVLVLCAPFAAQYFREPRVENVIQVLGLALLISGLENIGVVNFQKDMRFGKDFVFMFTKRFSGFVVTLVCAWVLQSYWALVIGTVFGRIVGVVCSYGMHPMRPRLGLVRGREMLGVSQWLLARTTGIYLEGQLHRMVVGRRDTAAALGTYTMAGDISAMPSTELLMPINRVLFPAFVTVKDRPEELKRVFLLAQSVQSLIAIPASAGLALVAPELVPLMLGDKWLMAVPFVQIFSLAYLAEAMLSSATCLMITLDHVKTLALFTWVQVLVFAGLAFLAFPGAAALEIAWLRLLLSAASAVAFTWLLLQIFEPLRWKDLLRGVARPLSATCVMFAGLQTLNSFWLPPSVSLALLSKVLLGAVLYAGAIAVLWRAAGAPAGAESYLLGYAMGLMKKRKHRNDTTIPSTPVHRNAPIPPGGPGTDRRQRRH
ncbi:MAG: lipopolysaccharide biosynthesis protein [Pseudomonadota bacterium]